MDEEIAPSPEMAAEALRSALKKAEDERAWTEAILAAIGAGISNQTEH